MGQTTSQAEIIFNLIISLFSSKIKGKMTNLSQLKEKSGLNEEDWENVLSYSAQVSLVSTYFEESGRRGKEYTIERKKEFNTFLLSLLSLSLYYRIELTLFSSLGFI